MITDEQHTNGYPNVTTFFLTFYDDVNKRYLNGTNTTDEPFQSFIVPVWRQAIWIIIFAGIVITATVGNMIVIWIVASDKRMRSVTHCFLINLSVADFMMATLNVTFNFTYMLHSDWPFGDIYCKICQCISVLSIAASVFTLMAISIDRYMAIIKPLRPRLSKRATWGVMTAIWVISLLISSPNFIYYTSEAATLSDGSIIHECFAKWPDYDIEKVPVSVYEFHYNVAYMVVCYFMPIIAMMYTYARVGLELWGSKAIGECTQAQLESIRSKRRVVKMMMVVVGLFAGCWLPFHAYFVVTAIYPSLTREYYIKELYLFIYWLAMSNSMYNPIIYYWMNSKFKRGFKQAVKCCRRHPSFSTDRLERSGRSLSRSRKNGTSTIRMSMHSTYNNTMVTST